ncbi:MAG: cyclic nucleotide-binding domain-containing protein [Deltaproteobacteria bacterium]|nr:cyclic nucleotide-binding domain-containing protein [Deltaproteobacteria bacterium]
MLKVGDLSRRLGKTDDAVAVYRVAAERYARDGMLLRGIAVCKVVLDIAPDHTEIQEMLAELYAEQYGKPTPTEIAAEDAPEIEIDLSSFAPAEPVAPRSLPEVPLFSDLDRGSFVELVSRAPVHRLAAGERVLEQGDHGESFFVILSGKVRVLKGGQQLAELAEGAFFGEMALLVPGPRQASVEAIEPSEILEIANDELKRLEAEYPSISETLGRFTDQRLLRNLLLSAPLFAPFTAEERRSLFDRFSPRSYHGGAIVIAQGDDVDGLFLIVSGSAEVSHETETGERRVLSTLGENDVFGEISLLTHAPATATVRATRDTRTLLLGREVFTETIMTHPQILELLSGLSEERMRDIEQQLERPPATGRDDGSALL